MTSTHIPIAVVTGAAGGIGTAISRRLGQSGRVALVGRNRPRLDALAKELGRGASVHVMDLTIPKEVGAGVRDIIEQHGTIDVLINNAGLRPDRLLTTVPFEETVALWDEQLAVNLSTAAYMSFAVAPHLRRPGGRIVNITSIAAQTGGSRPGSTGYAAAKAGLHGVTLGLSRELASLGITVNSIAPGFVADTGFTGNWAPDVVQALVDATPVGRAGTPEDIAAAVAYLVSDEASMVTAQLLSVNGGTVPSR